MKCGECGHPPGKHASQLVARNGGDRSTPVNPSSQPVVHKLSTPVASQVTKQVTVSKGGGHQSTPVKHPQTAISERRGHSSTSQLYLDTSVSSSSSLPKDEDGSDETIQSSISHSLNPGPRRRRRRVPPMHSPNLQCDPVATTQTICSITSLLSRSLAKPNAGALSSFSPPTPPTSAAQNSAEDDLVENFEQTNLRAPELRAKPLRGILRKPSHRRKEVWHAEELSPREMEVQDSLPVTSRNQETWDYGSGSSESGKSMKKIVQVYFITFFYLLFRSTCRTSLCRLSQEEEISEREWGLF